MLEFRAGEGRYCVQLAIHETQGNGLCCLVTGGELAHVGGMAVCFQGETEPILREISIPNHKDSVLARQLAWRLFQSTKQNVSVTAGIHIDHASGDEIKILCNNAFAAVEKYLLYNRNTCL